jgi:hypothetical protein
MSATDQQQSSTALSFNGRTRRFERRNVGSRPTGGASDMPLGTPRKAFADTFSAESIILSTFFSPPAPARYGAQAGRSSGW